MPYDLSRNIFIFNDHNKVLSVKKSLEIMISPKFNHHNSNSFSFNLSKHEMEISLGEKKPFLRDFKIGNITFNASNDLEDSW